MVAFRRTRRWLLFTLLWVALLAFIWGPLARTTMKFHRTVIGSMPNGKGSVPLYKMDPIDDPQPPSRYEIVLRGTCGTVVAVFAWIFLRIAMRKDDERYPKLQRKHRQAAKHDMTP
jgi:hypothetical protein